MTFYGASQEAEKAIGLARDAGLARNEDIAQLADAVQALASAVKELCLAHHRAS